MSSRLTICLTAAVLTVIIKADSIKTGDNPIVLESSNVTWFNAQKECIESSQGQLVSVIEPISCKSIPEKVGKITARIWSGGFKIMTWVQTEGCYSVDNTTQRKTASSLENCISKCNTTHVGFSSPLCMCYKTLFSLIPKPFNDGCKTCRNKNNCLLLPFYTVLDLKIPKTEIDLNESCIGLYVNCTERGAELMPDKCSSNHNVICENNVARSSKAYTLPDAENACMNNNSVINKDFNQTCAVNGSPSWTSLKMFWRDPVPGENGLQDEYIINHCTFVYCVNDMTTGNNTFGNCNMHLDGFACRNNTDLSPVNGKEITGHQSEHTSRHFTNGKTTQPTTSQLKVMTVTTDNVQSPTGVSTKLESTFIKMTTESQTKQVLVENAPNLNIGTIIGIIVGVTTIASVSLLSIVLLIRRRSKEKTSKPDSNTVVNNMQSNNDCTENYESPWDSERGKTNSLVFQSVLPVLDNKSVPSLKKNTDIDLNTYAVVNKARKDKSAFQVQDPTANRNITIKNASQMPSDTPEDEYDRLDRISNPGKIKTLSDNVYDCASGSRDTEDATYNTMDHDESWREGKAATTLDHYS